ncbi:MAG TPA: arginine--tRNA ligase [Candidatus Hydrogenedentes bacterium]|nr:arginine--tRNA ligase [Candidatus Hydrogenedentota bacterium]
MSSSLRQAITRAMQDLFDGLGPEDVVFSAPPSVDQGDIALPMFAAARKLRVAPPKLAMETAARLRVDDRVLSAAAAGPYVNLRLNRPLVGEAVIAEILATGGRWGSGGTGLGRRVLIEHTSINPNASPHVGRGRNAMIGDSLTRLLRFEGYDVEVHYYVNDMGRQIGLLVLIAEELEHLDFQGILDTYVRANARAEADPEFAARGYELLARMESGDPDTRARFRRVTDLCLQGQLEVLARLGASYDCFDHESDYVNDPRLEKIEAALRKKGALFVDEEQRLVVDLRPLGHEPDEGRYFVLRRANGSSMYGYRDLAYTMDKMSRGAEINLQVLGEDHKLYAQQIALILAACGCPAPETIYYSYILLKDGKMSTRQGKVVLLSDFLDQAAALAAERVAEQFPDLDPAERRAIAEQVAVAAIRFAVLRVKPGRNVTFDMDAALSFQGDTGPYIQYSCARIRSILRKADGEATMDACTEPPDRLDDAEWLLIRQLEAFPAEVAEGVAQRSVAGIANYALETARLFTTFYHECPVLKAGAPERTAFRLRLCRATLATLENALGILGIVAPERM